MAGEASAGGGAVPSAGSGASTTAASGAGGASPSAPTPAGSQGAAPAPVGKSPPASSGAQPRTESSGAALGVVQKPGETVKEAVERMLDLGKDGDAKIRITIDGKEETLTLKEAASRVQKRGAAEKRFEEARATKAEGEAAIAAVERFEKLLSEGREEEAEALLERVMGSDRFSKVVKARMAREARMAAMTPEERAQLEAQERSRTLDEREAKIKEAEAQRAKEAEEAEVTKLTETARAGAIKAFKPALEAAGLPLTPQTMGEMAQIARTLLAAGKAVDPKAIAAHMKRTHEARVTEARTAALGGYKSLKGKELVSRLEADFGPEFLAELRAAEVERLRAPHDPAARTAGVTPPRDQQGRFQPPARPKTFKEILAEADAERRAAAAQGRR